MKKLFSIFIVLLGINVTGSYACSPVIYYSVTIIIFDDGIQTKSQKYNYDLMINKTDYPEYIDDVVNDQYKLDYYNYNSFSYLDDGDWVSYSAYYNGIFHENHYTYSISFNSMENNGVEEYKIVVFDDQGQVIKLSEVYNTVDYGYIPLDGSFKSIAHTFDENDLTFGVEEIGNGCDDINIPVSILYSYIKYFLGFGALVFLVFYSIKRFGERE